MLQSRLFDPGPERDDNWWHYSRRPQWREGSTEPVHVGTQEAALERGLGANLGANAAATWNSRAKAADGMLYRMRHDAPMLNTPDEPVSDRLANKSFHGTGWAAGSAGGPTYDDKYRDGDGLRVRLGEGGALEGVYYRNAAENRGSVSAIVPQGKHLEITEAYRVHHRPYIEREGVRETTYSQRYAAGDDLPDGRNLGTPAEYTVAAQPRLFPVEGHQKTRVLNEPQFIRVK